MKWNAYFLENTTLTLLASDHLKSIRKVNIMAWHQTYFFFIRVRLHGDIAFHMTLQGLPFFTESLDLLSRILESKNCPHTTRAHVSVQLFNLLYQTHLEVCDAAT